MGGHFWVYPNGLVLKAQGWRSLLWGRMHQAGIHPEVVISPAAWGQVMNPFGVSGEKRHDLPRVGFANPGL